jgi:ATP-dependent DNA helicase RecG
VEDDGSVSCIDPTAQREQVDALLRAAYEYCTPSIPIDYKLYPFQGTHILVIDTPPSPRVHNHTNGRVFLRVLDRDQPLNADETMRVAFGKGQASYEAQPVRGATLEAVDHDLVREYARLRGLEQPIERILTGLNLLVDDTLTIAGVLLFAQEPSRWLPRAGVDFLKFEGKEVNLGGAFNLVKREDLSAPLPRLIRRTWEVIEPHIRTRHRLQGLEMVGQPEYPDFAWREIVVNAIAHRDYSITGTSIQVRIFDDRLEVESPGGLPGIVTVENIRQRHFSRNPILVGVLRTWHYIEELGFGIDRVFRAMEEIGALPPKIVDDGGVVTVTLHSSDSSGYPIDDSELNPRQLKAWQIIRSAGSISRKEYAALVGVSSVTAFRDLNDMLDKGFLRTVGSGRSRRYAQGSESKSA